MNGVSVIGMARLSWKVRVFLKRFEREIMRSVGALRVARCVARR